MLVQGQNLLGNRLENSFDIGASIRGSINTLFLKIKKYQLALKPREFLENELNRANSTYLYQ